MKFERGHTSNRHHFADDLTGWIKGVQARRHTHLRYENALLNASGSIKYAVYRLKYFISLNVFSIVVHALQFYIIAQHPDRTNVINSLFELRLAQHVLSNGIWGALEVMRQRCSALHKRGPSKLDAEFGAWQACAIFLIAAILVVAVALMIVAYLCTETARLTVCYASTILLEVAMSLMPSVRRAAIAALFRVRRPFVSSFVAPFVGVVTFGALWSILKEYALVISALCTAAVSTAISLRYIRACYNDHGLPRSKRPTRLQFTEFVRRLSGSGIALSAMAGVSMHSAELLFPLILARKLAAHSSALGIIYVSILLSRACVMWPAIFYKDLIKLENGHSSIFAYAFRQRFLFISMAIGIILWVPAVIIDSLHKPADFFAIAACLLFMFVWRAQFGWLQMIAFCRRAYWPLIITSWAGSLVLAGVFAGGITSRNPFFFIIFGISGCVLASALLWLLTFAPHANIAVGRISTRETMVSYVEWFRLVRSTKSKGVVIRVNFSETVSLAQRTRLIREVLPKSTGIYLWTFLDQRVAVGFGKTPPSRVVELTASQGAGFILGCSVCPLGSSGADAISEAHALGFFLTAEALSASNDGVQSMDLAELVSWFARSFPDGLCVMQGWGQAGKAVAGRSVLDAARAFVFNGVKGAFFADKTRDVLNASALLLQRRFSSWNFSLAVAANGRYAIFCVPAVRNKHQVKQWLANLYLWNVSQNLPRPGMLCDTSTLPSIGPR